MHKFLLIASLLAGFSASAVTESEIEIIEIEEEILKIIKEEGVQSQKFLELERERRHLLESISLDDQEV